LLPFDLSDVFAARDRFGAARYLSRLVGPPLYYGGQFRPAFSIGPVA